MPRKVDEFETDDEWSFISPGVKPTEKSSASIDFTDCLDWQARVSNGRRKQSSGGSQRQSARHSDIPRNAPHTYSYKDSPNGRSQDGYQGCGGSDEDCTSASGSSGGKDRQDWWDPGSQMRPQRGPYVFDSSSYSSRDTSNMANGRSAHSSRKGLNRLGVGRVPEVLKVADGGRVFVDSADGYDDAGPTSDEAIDEALQAWLAEADSHGFIRVYSPSSGDGVTALGGDTSLLSRLIPCTTAAEAHEICHAAGLPPSSLHVQLNGDIVRRLDAYERPLAMQNEYLARIGYTDVSRIQREGLSTDLGYLIRFCSGKSFDDSTYARRQLSSVVDVRAGGLLQRWSKRLCAICGTKLTINKDKVRSPDATTLQLAKGSVEEVKFKGHDHCIKITTSCVPQKTVFLSFSSQNDYNRWLKKAKKATAKLPSSADLSGCNLEFLPETVFTNDQLTMLNLRHNALRSMPTEENIYTIGWLDDISRFTHLKSLNLADNGLDFFPPAICDIATLVELNLATNRIAVVPAAISQLTSLQALHLHNNRLSTLPPEVTLLKKLAVLVLAFNKFRHVPASVAMLTDVRVSECDTLVMAGNSIEAVPGDVIAKLRHVKRIDLRMNSLTLPLSETVRFNQLEHLTHLDIRDNRATDLDLRYVKTLEYLNCERNGTRVLQLHGGKLKNIVASRNDIQQILINPKPEWLETLDFSRNLVEKLPEWLPECYFLTRLNVCYNRLTTLPQRMFAESPKLKYLQADHNRLKVLPSEVGVSMLEEVYLHANQIQELPHAFLSKTNKLRVLNVSGNLLTGLPPASDTPDLNKLQELYIASNVLQDDCLVVVSRYVRLKVLHIAHNSIRLLTDQCVSSLELLQELNVSANQIETLPQALEKLEHLRILRAHSNKITRLPRLDVFKAISVFDVSCNPLHTVSAADLLSMGNVHALDISGRSMHYANPSGASCRRCFKSKVKELDDLRSPQRRCVCELTHVCDVGITESHGSRNKLCVAGLCEMQLYERNEALFGIIDGGKNDEVARTIKNSLPHIVNEELTRLGGDGFGAEKDARDLDYLKYSFLTAHKKLRNSSQRLGASVILCHVLRYGEVSENRYRVNIANVGDARAILSRRGEIVQLSRSHVVPDDREECRRVSHSDGIVTEEGKVNGISHLSRCIGNSYLYPQVIPLPNLASEPLKMTQDEFLVIANGAFWRYVTYGEAVQMAARASSATAAAKSLQDLAQAYGCSENLCVVLVRFGMPSEPQCRDKEAAEIGPSGPNQPSQSYSEVNPTGDQLDAQSEDNYVNVDSLRKSGHITPMWDSKSLRRPIPTPRTSLVKVYDGPEASDEENDGDECEEYDFSSATDDRRPCRHDGGPRWSATMVRDWQFRSDGFLVNAPSSSSSSTLTASSERSNANDDADGDESGCSHTARGNRSRRSRLGANGLPSKHRLCSSDTKLQYPSAIELGTSENYFNRPLLTPSSQGSLVEDGDADFVAALAEREFESSMSLAYSNRESETEILPDERGWRLASGSIEFGAQRGATSHEYLSDCHRAQQQRGAAGAASTQSIASNPSPAADVTPPTGRPRTGLALDTLSEADIRALQNYSDSSLLTYKDESAGGGRRPASGAFYYGSEKSRCNERSSTSAVRLQPSAVSSLPSAVGSQPSAVGTQPSATGCSPLTNSSLVPAIRDRVPGVAAKVPSANGCAADVIQRLHPGVHKIEYYQEQPGKLPRKDKGSNESSSAYGSLAWSSSTVSQYDTYL